MFRRFLSQLVLIFSKGQSLEECGVPQTSSSATGSPTSPSGPSSQTPGSSTSTKSSRTVTGSGTLSVTSSQCPATTVTSWATTTVVSTVSIAATTVTVVGPGGGCYSESSTSLSASEPSSDISLSGTITQPPLSSSTSYGLPVSFYCRLFCVRSKLTFF